MTPPLPENCTSLPLLLPLAFGLAFAFTDARADSEQQVNVTTDAQPSSPSEKTVSKNSRDACYRWLETAGLTPGASATDAATLKSYVGKLLLSKAPEEVPPPVGVEALHRVICFYLGDGGYWRSTQLTLADCAVSPPLNINEMGVPTDPVLQARSLEYAEIYLTTLARHGFPRTHPENLKRLESLNCYLGLIQSLQALSNAKDLHEPQILTLGRISTLLVERDEPTDLYGDKELNQIANDSMKRARQLIPAIIERHSQPSVVDDLEK